MVTGEVDVLCACALESNCDAKRHLVEWRSTANTHFSLNVSL